LPRILRSITGLDEAESLWRSIIPPETIFDLWEVRAAFNSHYQRSIRFIVSDDSEVFLPLSWVEEKNRWCFFPGELWSGKTWLEQNRLIAGGMDGREIAELLGDDFHFRYLTDSSENCSSLTVDETGYLFHPPACQYDIQNWWSLFRNKTRKNLQRELAGFSNARIEIRHGVEEHFHRLVEMSISRFGASSYFAEPRFAGGFNDMLQVIAQMGLLRVTAIELDGVLAAVDIGSVYRGRYTLLAGGTDARFPGIAKLINLQHLQWGCEQRLDEVDFLCGDFLWKPLFHLTPRPLYLLSSQGNH